MTNRVKAMEAELAATRGAPEAPLSSCRGEGFSHGASATIRKRLARAAKHVYVSLNPVIRHRRSRWLNEEGVDFLRRLGIGPGDAVVDFGCGPGNYSIPAARVVGAEGVVVALDVNERALARLRRAAGVDAIRQIRPARRLDEVPLLLDNRPCKAVLIFDVLHFMGRDERRRIYRAFHAMLSHDGLLSVHPKHLRDDEPSRFFSDMSIEEVVQEIEAVGFLLHEREPRNLWHGHGREPGVVLSFRRGINAVAGGLEPRQASSQAVGNPRARKGK